MTAASQFARRLTCRAPRLCRGCRRRVLGGWLVCDQDHKRGKFYCDACAEREE